MNPPKWDDMLATPSLEAEFIIVRTAEVQVRDGLDRTVSAEAMEEMSLDINTFIGTRIARYHDQTGLAPQTVRVLIRVEVNA